MKFGPTHVLKTELEAIWDFLLEGDILALYQHQTNKAGKPWVHEKKDQFDRVLNACSKVVQAQEPVSKQNAGLPRDVVIFYARKTLSPQLPLK